MFCQKCGHEVPDNAMFCENCGSPLKKTSSSSFKLPSVSLTKSQQISLIACAIWFIVWIFIRAIAFDDDYDKELCLLVAIFVPILFLLVKWLIPLIKAKNKVVTKNNVLSLSDFLKQYDGMRVETVFNKLSETTETYCVFYNNTRALFGSSLNNCTPDDFKNQMKDLIIIQNKGKYVVERKDSQINSSSE